MGPRRPQSFWGLASTLRTVFAELPVSLTRVWAYAMPVKFAVTRLGAAVMCTVPPAPTPFDAGRSAVSTSVWTWGSALRDTVGQSLSHATPGFAEQPASASRPVEWVAMQRRLMSQFIVHREDSPTA